MALFSTSNEAKRNVPDVRLHILKLSRPSVLVASTSSTMARRPSTTILFIFISSFLSCFIGFGSVRAQPAALQFQDCFTGNDTLKINVATVYGQILTSSPMQKFLNLTVFGESGQVIAGFSNESSSLGIVSTLVHRTMLDFSF
jgi:hypothetical protein